MEDLREQDANVLSDWSGSMTPPLMESDDEIIESQCVVPLQKKNFEGISIIAKENGLLNLFYMIHMPAKLERYCFIL